MSSDSSMAGARPTVPPADPFGAMLGSSFKVGLATGGVGFLFGGAAGILKNTTPFLFATASGLQTFILGSTFWGVRSGIQHAWPPEQRTPADDIKASALSGGITGGVVAMITRGRSNVLPGTLMFTLFGGAGQALVNRYYSPLEQQRATEHKDPLWKRMAASKWSPVKVMNDEEYVTMLRERMLRIDVEIAVLDDKIAALKQEQASSDPQQSSTSHNP